MNDLFKNLSNYKGLLTSCCQCIQQPNCNIVKKHDTYTWAIKVICPNCKHTFFLCSICLPHHSTQNIVAQLQNKRLKKHSIGKLHTQMIGHISKVTNSEQYNEEHDYMYSTSCDTIFHNKTGVKISDTYFDRDQSHRYFSNNIISFYGF